MSMSTCQWKHNVMLMTGQHSIPFPLDARLASQFADEMLQRGIYVIGFSFPVVPKGQARIRVQVSAGHSEADIERCVNAFVEVRNKLIPKA